MSAKERNTLIEIAKTRARVAKGEIDRRAAHLRAECERELCAVSAEDEAWRDIVDEAKAAAKHADEELARRCKARGIRASFRPTIYSNFYGRGENATRERRAELRKLAETLIAADAKEAKHEIEKWTAEVMMLLMAGLLESAAARASLDTLPSIEALLPAPTLVALDALTTRPGLRILPGECDTSTANIDGE
ncbi:hypothetical protein VSR72_13520 [Paraburkholderia sp. JHI869]